MSYLVGVLILTAAFAAAGQQSADLIIVNANVRTIVTRDARARAIAVRDGRIIAAGTDVAIENLAGPGTQRIDAGGRLVLPGFNDAHVHLTGIGNIFSHLDVADRPIPT